MIAKIPLFTGSNRAVDELELTAFKPELRDGFVDEAGNIRKKPGLEFVIDLSVEEINGLFWWEKQQKAVAITDRKIFTLTSAAGDGSDIVATDITGTDLPETLTRSYFADFGANLYHVNGGRIIKIPATGTPAFIADVDAPTNVSHIAAMDTYLLALKKDTGQMHYSNVGDPDNWTGEWITAESSPDDAKALHVARGRFYIWGTDSLQVGYNDGVTPFVWEFGGHIETGLLAPHAVAYAIDTFYWLDHNRNLVKLVGNTAVNVPQGNPQGLSLYIQGFSTVTDAVLDYIQVGGRHFIVMAFPTEKTTLLFDIIANTWVEWNRWNINTSTYERWIANAFTFCDAWNIKLIGDNDRGFIYKMKLNFAQEGVFDYLQDNTGAFILDSSGKEISTSASVESTILRLLIRTGQINHDTLDKRKFSSKYTLTAKRPTAYLVDNVTLKLRYRDNGSNTWSAYKNGIASQMTDTLFRFTWNRNGSYYERQIEIVNEDNVPLLINRVLEETLHVEA